MKRHGYLFEKLVSFENLQLAAQRACRGKRAKPDAAQFYFNLENEIIRLQRELSSGEYCPKPYRQFEIREPKIRQICCSDFLDRVVHHAICNLLEPIFESRMIFHTYACRRNKGSHAAIEQCQQFARSANFFLKCDIRKYFDSIDQGVLKMQLLRTIKDQRFLSMLFKIIDHQVPGAPADQGLPIGNLTSQYFANFYLSAFDRRMEEAPGVGGYLRYMDDFICFSQCKSSLKERLTDIRLFAATNLKLELKEKVTTLAPVSDGIGFLGFRVYPRLIRIQRPNLNRMRKKVRLLERLFEDGIIPQRRLVDSVRSMTGHALHADSKLIREEIFRSSLKIG
jgi:hypothetical protein